MHAFITKAGQRTETARFMDAPKLRPGYWWEDRAPLGSGRSEWHEVVAPHSTKGTLFGYDECEFMAKQYR